MCSFQLIMINICLLLIIILGDVSSNFILPEYEHCNAPLGMESGSITDYDLTSSSTHDESSVGPQMARIRSEIEGGAWCPEKPVGINSYEYLQIDLRQLFFINAIETQGRFGNGQGREFAEFYQIQYQRDNQSSQWITYYDKTTNKTVFDGNKNTYSAEKRSLSTSILAKRIRIIPFSTRWRTVCMRVELYGCPFYGGVTSYTTSPSVEKDPTYDGGIGKLVDGIIGNDDNSNILIWNKSPVSIEFNFDYSRQFKTIQIYTINNQYQYIDIKFDQYPLIKHYISPKKTSFSNLFLDTIQLNNYGNIFLGQRIEFIFEFTQHLSLTEITFESELASILLTNSTPTNCSIVIQTTNSTYLSSSFKFFLFDWLTISIVSFITICFICFLIISIYCFRRCLQRNKNFYYKTSQMTTTTSGSCASTSSEHDSASTLARKNHHHQFFLSNNNNYDDVTSEQQSMGSYIYPITSTTSLLQTTPSSSIFKSEQYAVIDGNYSVNCYKQWPTNNTFHYATSDIGKLDKLGQNQRISLFNCIVPQENLSIKSSQQLFSTNIPSDVDQTNLSAMKKLSETKHGEIYLGNYLIDHETKAVLIKIIKTNSIHSTRERFLNELDILSRLKHKNIACLYAIQLDLLYLIQEYSIIGTLHDYFHQISNQQINDINFQKMNIYFAYQLANAIQYLNHLNLIHGDIATRNCLIYSDNTIKLTDCARILSQYQHEYWTINNNEQIPLRWMAPELLTSNATLKSDIYSYAVTLWEIWSRCSSIPYAQLTNEEVYQGIFLRKIDNRSNSSFYLSVPPDCPKEIYDLLCECWHIDGTKRPNISDITLYFRRHVEATRLINI